MINNKKKITEVDLRAISVFLSNYNLLDKFSQIVETLDLIIDKEKPSYVQPEGIFIATDDRTVFDVLDLCTSVRVRVYFRQIVKVCKLVKPSMNDNFISKTLYQIKLKHKETFNEKIQGTYMVWSKVEKEYTNTKKPLEGEFSYNSDSNTHESLLPRRTGKRVVFLEPLEKNAERQTKVYLATKYHPETWVVSEKNAPKDIYLFNWQESTDHIRTYYSRELGVKHDDVRCRRLKNYVKVR